VRAGVEAGCVGHRSAPSRDEESPPSSPPAPEGRPSSEGSPASSRNIPRSIGWRRLPRRRNASEGCLNGAYAKKDAGPVSRTTTPISRFGSLAAKAKRVASVGRWDAGTPVDLPCRPAVPPAHSNRVDPKLGARLRSSPCCRVGRGEPTLRRSLSRVIPSAERTGTRSRKPPK